MPLFSIAHHDNETSLFSSECTVGALNTALMELSLTGGGPSSSTLHSPTRFASPGGGGAGKASTPPLGAAGEKSSGASSTAAGGSGSNAGVDNNASVAGSRGGSGVSGSASHVAKSKRISQMAGQALSLLDATAGIRSGGAVVEVLQSSKTNVHSSASKSSSARSPSPMNGIMSGGGGSKKRRSVEDGGVSAAASAGGNVASAGYRGSTVSAAHYRKLELIPLSYVNDLLNNPKLQVALQTAVAQREQQQQQLGLAGAASGAASGIVGTAENGVSGAGATVNAAPFGGGSPSTEGSPLNAVPNMVSFAGATSMNASVGAGALGSSPAGLPMGGSTTTPGGANAALLSLLHTIPFVGLMTLPVHNSVLDTFTANTSFILLGCREKESDGRGNPFPALSAKRAPFLARGAASPATFLASSSTSSPSVDSSSLLLHSRSTTAPPPSQPYASFRGSTPESRSIPPLSASLTSATASHGVRTGGPDGNKSGGGVEGISADVLTTVEPFGGETLRQAGYGLYVVEHCGGHPMGTQGMRALPLSTRAAAREGKRGDVSLHSSLGTIHTGNPSTLPSPLMHQGEGSKANHGVLSSPPPPRTGGKTEGNSRGVPPWPGDHAASSIHSVATMRGSEGGMGMRSYAGTSAGGSMVHFPPCVAKKAPLRANEVYDMIQMAQKLAAQPVSRAPLQAVTLVPFVVTEGLMGADGCIFPVLGGTTAVGGGAGGQASASAAAHTTTSKHAAKPNGMAPGAGNTPSSSTTTKKGDRSGRHGSGVSLEENTVHYGPRRLLTKEMPPSSSLLTSPTAAGSPAVARLHGGGGRGPAGEGGGAEDDGGSGGDGPNALFQTTQPPASSGTHESAAAPSRRRSSNKEFSGRGGREGKSGGERQSLSPKRNSARSRAAGGGGGGDTVPSSATASPFPSSGNTSARGGHNASQTLLPTPPVSPIFGEGEDGEPLQWEIHPEVPLSSAACGMLYQSPLTFAVSMNTGAVSARNASGAAKRNQVEENPRNAVAMLLSSHPEDAIVTTLSAAAAAVGPGGGGGGGGGQGSSSGAAGGGNSAGPGTGSPTFPSGGSGVKTHILERMESFDVLWRGSSGEHEILAWLLQEYLKMMKAKIVAANQQAVGSSSSGTDEVGRKDNKRRRNGSGSTTKGK